MRVGESGCWTIGDTPSENPNLTVNINDFEVLFCFISVRLNMSYVFVSSHFKFKMCLIIAVQHLCITK
jgi:hypothetical protein